MKFRRTPEQPKPDGSGDIAQRPRLATRLRLVPLALLVALALGLGVLGRLVDTPLVDPAVTAANAQRVADRTARRAAKKCTPPYVDGRAAGDPWSPARAGASQRAFRTRIKKEDAAYVSGRRGFKFFTDYQSEDFSQSIGRVTQTEEQERAWARFFLRTQHAARAAGGDFRVVIAPSKGDVYRQNLPSWATALRGETSLERLLADHPEVPWIDTRAALRRAAAENATYEALNNHWTPYGGYVAWDAITSCLRLTPGFESLGVPAITGVTRTASLNDFAAQGVPDRADRTVAVYAAPHPLTTIRSATTGSPIAGVLDSSVDMNVLPVITTTATQAQTPGPLLVLRDSTGSALSGLWSTSFATTVQYSHGLGTTQRPPTASTLIAQYRPALTLFVMTERYLDLPAPR